MTIARLNVPSPVPPVPKVSPDDITAMPENYVFVFGSNQAGIHGAGAAKQAWLYFGAEWGVGEGLTGRSYAIPTKDKELQVRRLDRIGQSIEMFVGYARACRTYQFYLTKIGCGLAGYRVDQIAPLFFVGDLPPENIWWPREFLPWHPYEFKRKTKS